MRLPDLLAFSAAFFAFAVSPGPANALIVARTVTHGPWHGVAYGAGTTFSILCFLGLAELGLMLIEGSMAFILRGMGVVGAAYLMWYGVVLCMSRPAPARARSAPAGGGLASSFAAAVALTLANPKMPLFYGVLLPSTVTFPLTPSAAALLSAAVVAVEVLVVGGHVVLAQRARHLVRREAVARLVNRSAGVAMAGTGAVLLFAR